MLLTLLAIVCSNAFAEDVTVDGAKAPGTKFDTPETHLSAEFGGAWTNGNTAAWTLNGSLAGSHRVKRSEVSLGLGTNVGQSIVDADANAFLDDTERGAGYVPTAQKYTGALRYDYYVGENDSLYLANQDLIDHFAGFALRAEFELGYKRLLVDSDRLDAVGEIGAAVANERYYAPEGTEPAPAATLMGAKVKLGLDYKFNDNVSLSEGIEVFDPVYNFANGEVAVQDLLLTNSLGITAKLSDKFSLKVSDAITFDNVPAAVTLPDGSSAERRKLDNTTMATFVATLL